MPADLFQGVTPYSIEAEQIARRRKLAEAMQAQSLQMDPTQMVSGRAIPYSPVQGLNKLAQALSGARGQALATEESKGLSERYSAALARAMGGMPQPRQETYQQEQPGPVQPGQPPLSIPQQRTVQPSMQENAAWLGSLGQLGPGAVGMGGTLLGLQQKQQDRIMTLEANAMNLQNSREERAAARAQAEQLKRELQASQQTFQRSQSESQQAFQAQQRKESAADRMALARAFPQPVNDVTLQDPNDPNGTIVIDGRTKQVLGKGPKLSQVGGDQQKLALKLPQARLQVAATIQNIDRLDTALSELNDDPGLTNITGPVAGRTWNITEAATNAQTKLDSILSQTFVSALQAMREASKTGGAVGNVSDREGDRLQNTIAALGQAQGTANFKAQLKKARSQLKLSKELINSAFEEQFGGVQPMRRSTDKSAGDGWKDL